MEKIKWICLGGLVGLVCYPMLFLFTGSFMGVDEIANNLEPIVSAKESANANWYLIPMYPTIKNYFEIFLDTPQFFIMFWNSIKIVAGILIGQILVAILAAWGFARLRFPFQKSLFMIYTILMLLPFQVRMLSEYLVLDRWKLLDTLWSVIIPNIFATYPVFIMYFFFKGIPDSFIEAAKLDGAGSLYIFWKIGIPLGVPGITSAMVLGFLEYWSLIEQPMIFLENKQLWPLSMYLPNIELGEAGIAFAASIIALSPSLLIFFSGQAYLEMGIASTALKE